MLRRRRRSSTGDRGEGGTQLTTQPNIQRTALIRQHTNRTAYLSNLLTVLLYTSYNNEQRNEEISSTEKPIFLKSKSTPKLWHARTGVGGRGGNAPPILYDGAVRVSFVPPPVYTAPITAWTGNFPRSSPYSTV